MRSPPIHGCRIGQARTAGGSRCPRAPAIVVTRWLQPRRGNAERYDDNNAVRALSAPTRIRDPGPALQTQDTGFLAPTR